jgi:hypothetical protein
MRDLRHQRPRQRDRPDTSCGLRLLHDQPAANLNDRALDADRCLFKVDVRLAQAASGYPTTRQDSFELNMSVSTPTIFAIEQYSRRSVSDCSPVNKSRGSDGHPPHSAQVKSRRCKPKFVGDGPGIVACLSDRTRLGRLSSEQISQPGRGEFR